MTETSYSNVAVVFVAHADQRVITANEATAAVAVAVSGVPFDYGATVTEAVPSKFYTVERDRGHFELAGFTSIKRAVAEGRMVPIRCDLARPETVIAVAIPFTYTVPYTVRDIGAKAWEQLYARLAGRETRYGQFLRTGAVSAVRDLFGTGGAMTWVTGRTGEWGPFIARLREQADELSAATDSEDSDPELAENPWLNQQRVYPEGHPRRMTGVMTDPDGTVHYFGR